MAPLRMQLPQEDDPASPTTSKKGGAEEHSRPVPYTDPSPVGIDADPSQPPPVVVGRTIFHHAIRYPLADGGGHTTVSLGDYIQKKRHNKAPAPALGEVLCLLRRDHEYEIEIRRIFRGADRVYKTDKAEIWRADDVEGICVRYRAEDPARGRRAYSRLVRAHGCDPYAEAAAHPVDGRGGGSDEEATDAAPVAGAAQAIGVVRRPKKAAQETEALHARQSAEMRDAVRAAEDRAALRH
eukprot:CAMPEP_0194312882 /NCGR_PEP_ID=MMETSP0171-20130528/9800_1 /TAXON_ID=218684 /ORGANISM="Corethron pennatum, Strain L29A3" /LENGTH=238 /DNA_ID=CAMNT_0039067599 /DNA_START=227 /DNA_END=944 /DNA_ORIENTATION=-